MNRIPRKQLTFPIMERIQNPWKRAAAASSSDIVNSTGLTTLEVCAGAGGQALGFEQAGIEHAGLVELDQHACETLRHNRPKWKVHPEDLAMFDGRPYRGVDLVSGGLPCPPFSVAGKQLGDGDDRNLFPAMIRLVDTIRPRAVMIENVRGILDPRFDDYRDDIGANFRKLGYQIGWMLMNASDFGVPQLRPRVAFVALRKSLSEHFSWPGEKLGAAMTVGEVLFDLIGEQGWKGRKTWAVKAHRLAPTIVGGSLKHGGPDLGPTRARLAWAALGVDGLGIANEPPPKDFSGFPRLTVRMVARIQGFPDSWHFVGSKTQTYRQVGNAFPPPFARAIAGSLRDCLLSSRRHFVAAG
jgi:DNA (cytosine-5)-methyltransferase 1